MAYSIYRFVWGILHCVGYLMYPDASEGFTASIFRVTQVDAEVISVSKCDYVNE